MNEALKQRFYSCFGRAAEMVVSAPGRTELCGNHTDHQGGCVLAAAVDLDMKAAAARNGSGFLRVQSEGYPFCEIGLDEPEIRASEIGTTAALVRGVMAGFLRHGKKPSGMDIYVTSEVMPGSGLSSSAAFEVLIGAVLNESLPDGRFSAQELARLGQYAENVYFGKPCGLMDQTASAVGGILAIDFADTASPRIEKIPFDFSAGDYSICILSCGADHSDLTDEYAAITRELGAVSAFFGRSRLREVEEAAFRAKIPELRKLAGDRAVLRAMHVFAENRRVQACKEALYDGNMERFLRVIRESGDSSWRFLQNIIPTGAAAHQEMAIALATAEHALSGKGTCRVHGGGFAGTVQAFVRNEEVPGFRAQTEAILGSGSCRVLTVRQTGAVRLE